MDLCTCQRAWYRLDLCQKDCQQVRQHDRVSFRSLCCGQNLGPRKAVARHSPSPARLRLGSQAFQLHLSPCDTALTPRRPPRSRTCLQRTSISTTVIARISLFNPRGGLASHGASSRGKGCAETQPNEFATNDRPYCQQVERQLTLAMSSRGQRAEYAAARKQKAGAHGRSEPAGESTDWAVDPGARAAGHRRRTTPAGGLDPAASGG